MTVVVQGVVFRALPGDRGLGAATNSTSKNNGLPCLTRDLTQGNDEFWGNCRRKESGIPVTLGSFPTPTNPNKNETRIAAHAPALQKTHSPGYAPAFYNVPRGPYTLQNQRNKITTHRHICSWD